MIDELLIVGLAVAVLVVDFVGFCIRERRREQFAKLARQSRGRR